MSYWKIIIHSGSLHCTNNKATFSNIIQPSDIAHANTICLTQPCGASATVSPSPSQSLLCESDREQKTGKYLHLVDNVCQIIGDIVRGCSLSALMKRKGKHNYLNLVHMFYACFHTEGCINMQQRNIHPMLTHTPWNRVIISVVNIFCLNSFPLFAAFKSQIRRQGDFMLNVTLLLVG